MKSLIKIIITIITNALLPFFDIFQDIQKKINNAFKVEDKIIKEKIKVMKRDIKINLYISLAIYYILLLLLEFFMFLNILSGKIIYFTLTELVSISILTIIFSFVFVSFLNKYFKTFKFSYFIYFQLLFLLPLIMTYWVATIEGHVIYLKQLNSDQWISMFNTIIIYISGCLIGIVTLYKSNENKKDTIK